MTILIIIAHPITIALLCTLIHLKKGGISALPLKANLVLSTFSSRKDQAGVHHIFLFSDSVNMCPPAEHTSPLHRDGGVNGHSIVLYGSGGGA